MNSFIFVRSSLQLLLAAGVVNAVRQLPAELEVDLIFPRDNETYAPTQLLPIVFGFNNLDAVWPLNIGLDVSVASIGDDFNQSRPHWKHRWVGFLSDWLDDIVGDSPPRRYRCFANNDTESRWSNGPGYASRGIFFQTADGAQRPDVEAAANSCEESDENTSAAVRIADFKKNSYDKPCPVFDTDVKPKCAFKSAAKEVAANVSAAMLRRMRCEEGEWQTITAPCPRKESKGCAAGFAVGWGIVTPIQDCFLVAAGVFWPHLDNCLIMCYYSSASEISVNTGMQVISLNRPHMVHDHVTLNFSGECGNLRRSATFRMRNVKWSQHKRDPLPYELHVHIGR